MAVLAYFLKTSEGDTTVTYRVGEYPEEMTDILTIDKATRSGIPADKPVPHHVMAAGRKIVSLLKAEGDWPEEGMTAS